MGFSTTREIVIETDGFVTVCVELLNGIPREEVEAAIISSDGSAIGVCGMFLAPYFFVGMMFTKNVMS